MQSRLLSFTTLMTCLFSSVALASDGPQPATMQIALPVAADIAYPGTVTVAVDATDTSRRIVSVHETMPVTQAEMILRYPKWLPGTHAPEGPIDRLAGLIITANGKRINWTRDLVDVHAFHVSAPMDAKTLDIHFQYLSPTSEKVGVSEISRDVLTLEWNALLLYPAGYYVRQIPVAASVKIPTGWTFASALDRTTTTGDSASFKTVPVETLVDSPIYAGRYSRTYDLDPQGPVPVRLNLFADRPELLEAKPAYIDAHRALVQQAYKLYGSHHYDHYDFLVSLSDQVQYQGLEHHRSSEDGTQPTYFTEWDKTSAERDLLPHEFTHSWNGKFRRPANLWTPDYAMPMRDSLLWVYEGQTEYWGKVLSARSGLRTKEQARDELALIAAELEHPSGRTWRTLQDTTNDEIINPRRPMSWHSYQRFEDYYDEGALIWLEADTLIRQQSNNVHSLDDFAKAFFGINNGSYTPVTYDFEAVVKTLNTVMPYDWSSFLHTRLDTVARGGPMEGLSRGGYRLVFNETENTFEKEADDLKKQTSFRYSIGMVVKKEGDIGIVYWDSPAFRANLTEGGKILSVNGIAYDPDVLNYAVKASKANNAPIELIIKTEDRYTVAQINYHNGLRYAHLERVVGTPARLDDILTARP